VCVALLRYPYTSTAREALGFHMRGAAGRASDCVRHLRALGLADTEGPLTSACIKGAFRKQAQLTHPDLCAPGGGDPGALKGDAQSFTSAVEAKEWLLANQKYVRMLRSGHDLDIEAAEPSVFSQKHPLVRTFHRFAHALSHTHTHTHAHTHTHTLTHTHIHFCRVFHTRRR
jgi:hypothetical protein